MQLIDKIDKILFTMGVLSLLINIASTAINTHAFSQKTNISLIEIIKRYKSLKPESTIYLNNAFLGVYGSSLSLIPLCIGAYSIRRRKE